MSRFSNLYHRWKKVIFDTFGLYNCTIPVEEMNEKLPETYVFNREFMLRNSQKRMSPRTAFHRTAGPFYEHTIPSSLEFWAIFQALIEHLETLLRQNLKAIREAWTSLVFVITPIMKNCCSSELKRRIHAISLWTTVQRSAPDLVWNPFAFRPCCEAQPALGQLCCSLPLTLLINHHYPTRN